MARRSAQQLAVSTRDRILEAAILRFSQHSYEAVGLRDIAADVGVDVSYVHRCFGSKEKLFAAAVEATARVDKFLDDASGDPATALARQVFVHNAKHGRKDVGSLDIVIRSLTSQEATRVLREFALDRFIDPLSERLGHATNRQATLIAAMLFGVGIFRDVLTIAPMCDADDGELEQEIAAAIKAIARDRSAQPVRLVSSSNRKTKKPKPAS